MKLKETFSTIPLQYDKVRPDYPPTLFQDILNYSQLSKSDPILEIGIGTGKATLPFAKHGNPIIANDISRELIGVAKNKLKNYKKIKYVVGQFEKIILQKNKFGLIYSAQTFHWIKPNIQFTKTHSLLRQDGVLALFWNLNYYDQGIGKWALKLNKKYSSAKKGKTRSIIQQFKRHRLFKDAIIKEYRREIGMSKINYIKMQTSHSWYLVLSDKRKQLAMIDLQKALIHYPKIIKMPIKTILVMAKKNK
ncbi:MAG: class I SAM-dependent methyltransferase [Candidatus Kerfeldbacteria bacterium]